MPNSNGIIYVDTTVTPNLGVSISDVQTVLGETSGDLGTLCKSENINMWAWYKPVRFPSVKVINEADRQTANYGLFYRENTAAEDLLLASTKTEEAFNDAASSSYEWSYLKPQGNTNSPYRLSDFVLKEQESGTGALIGYKHDTKPPFEIIKNTWEVSYAELSSVANTYFVENDSSSQYDWSIKIYSSATGSIMGAGKQFYGYKMKYDSLSQYDINGPDSLAIPMKSLFGSNNIDGQSNYWRIGMIVYVPRLNNPFVGLFVSQKTLYGVKTGINGSNVQYLSVDMCTNQELAYMMYLYMDSISENEYTFRALPVLVQNATIGYGSAQGPQPDNFSGQSWHGLSKITVGNNIKIYPLPTGSIEIGIKVNKEDENIEPPRTYGDFELSVIPISTAEPYVNICAIAITSRNTIGEAKSAEIDLDYVIYNNVNGQEVPTTYTLNRTYTIPQNASFYNAYNSTTYNGIGLQQENPSIAGRKLVISKLRKFIVT